MNEPGHYRIAETDLEHAAREIAKGDLAVVYRALTRSQIHATLAVAEALNGLHATLNEALGEIRDGLTEGRSS